MIIQLWVKMEGNHQGSASRVWLRFLTKNMMDIESTFFRKYILLLKKVQSLANTLKRFIRNV